MFTEKYAFQTTCTVFNNTKFVIIFEWNTSILKLSYWFKKKLYKLIIVIINICCNKCLTFNQEFSSVQIPFFSLFFVSGVSPFLTSTCDIDLSKVPQPKNWSSLLPSILVLIDVSASKSAWFRATETSQFTLRFVYTL